MQTRFVDAPFGIAIPRAAQDAPLPDHIPSDIGEIFADRVLVAQIVKLLNRFIGQIFIDFKQFIALPDRLRQGQLHTLVLARLLHTGAFNQHPCFQGLDPALGVIAVDEQTYCFGASLGGIMGLLFASLSPDVERVIANVPAIDFSFLLQRSFAFAAFGDFLAFIEPDPLKQALGLQVLHEIWVRGESAGYANHITRNSLAPLAGTNAKRVLLTPGRSNPVVSPLGAQIAAAKLGIANFEGSIETNLSLVPAADGPLDSAHILYDTGSFVLGEDDAFIPPLANSVPSGDGGGCNPHGRTALIPAAIHQLIAFLTPSGVIENLCNGLCDAETTLELRDGEAESCDPTPWFSTRFRFSSPRGFVRP